MTRGFSLFLLLLAFSLSACGFRPLYERSGDVAPSEILARVALAPTSSGQVDVLHTQLRRYFGKRSAPSALYVLNLDVSLKEQDQLIRRDAQVTRHNVVYGVRYDLRSREGGKEPVFKDYLRLTISYKPPHLTICDFDSAAVCPIGAPRP